MPVVCGPAAHRPRGERHSTRASVPPPSPSLIVCYTCLIAVVKALSNCPGVASLLSTILITSLFYVLFIMFRCCRVQRQCFFPMLLVFPRWLSVCGALAHLIIVLEEQLSQENIQKHCSFFFQCCAFRFHAGICQELLLIWFCMWRFLFSLFTCCSKSVCAFQPSGS